MWSGALTAIWAQVSVDWSQRDQRGRLGSSPGAALADPAGATVRRRKDMAPKTLAVVLRGRRWWGKGVVTVRRNWERASS